MTTVRKTPSTLYVDRRTQQWVVLDSDGNYWMLSSSAEHPWSQRQPFTPTDDTELESVPGHYKYMLGLPA